MISKIIFPLIVIIFLSFSLWFFWRQIPVNDNIFISPNPSSSYLEHGRQSSYVYKNSTQDDISLPRIARIDSLTVRVQGSARGRWFFEAQFPIEILDKTGASLSPITPATASKDWMTADFVPYSVDLKLKAPYSGPATIVLHKDNTSGDPRRDASLQYYINL